MCIWLESKAPKPQTLGFRDYGLALEASWDLATTYTWAYLQRPSRNTFFRIKKSSAENEENFFRMTTKFRV